METEWEDLTRLGGREQDSPICVSIEGSRWAETNRMTLIRDFIFLHWPGQKSSAHGWCPRPVACCGTQFPFCFCSARSCCLIVSKWLICCQHHLCTAGKKRNTRPCAHAQRMYWPLESPPWRAFLEVPPSSLSTAHWPEPCHMAVLGRLWGEGLCVGTLPPQTSQFFFFSQSPSAWLDILVVSPSGSFMWAAATAWQLTDEWCSSVNRKQNWERWTLTASPSRLAQVSSANKEEGECAFRSTGWGGSLDAHPTGRKMTEDSGLIRLSLAL